MSIKTINTECTPEMLRAAALNSELGDLARNNLSGAWGLIIELWDVMVKAAIAVEQDLPQHYDDTAVVMFANAMKQKMAAKRNQGYSGWNDKEYCTTEKLQKMLIDHLAKGDPVDIGNFAMMLWSRGESVAAVEVEPSGREVLRNVFALCEETEDLETNTPNDYLRGRKFEAKAIRNAIGTWFTDECNSRKAAPVGWVSVTTRVPLESDGEVFVRFTDGSIGVARASYWHGSSNEFAQWTFPDPDENRAVEFWAKNPLDAETRALAISICEHVLSHTHPWAFIDEAKKLKELLGAE